MNKHYSSCTLDELCDIHHRLMQEILFRIKDNEPVSLANAATVRDDCSEFNSYSVGVVKSR